MQQGTPSVSAIGTAAACAVHRLYDDPPKVLDDPVTPVLGVTMFLTRPAVEATLRLVAGLPAPTPIVFSFIPSDDALPPEDAERKRTVIARFERGDEPWLTDFHPDALRDTLHGLGFRDVFLLTPEEAGARCLTGRRDGMRSRPVEQVYRATV